MTEGRDEISDKLGLDRDGRRPWWRRPWLWGMLVVLVLAVVVFGSGGKDVVVSYKTVPVVRGDLTVTVTATGTLQPVNQVDVGSELSGTIASVSVDYNDEVKRGQPLATLDTDVLKAHLSESQAALSSAEANVKEATATVTETRLDYRRCKDLLPQKMCSQSDLDKAKAAMERADAALSMAKAQVQMARATLDVQEGNLRKAVIRSPIDGIVLDRKVDPGQTVAASLQTPVLFTIAQDLSHMELIVAIDEADIGAVRVGQQASFTVDAFPDRSFSAKLTQIRRAPKTVDGVVSYDAVLQVDNSDLALLPGMTATAEITTQSLHDTLLVPNAALRYSPPITATSSRRRGVFAMLLPHRPPRAPEPEAAGHGHQRVWVLRDGQPVHVGIGVGATDGAHTVVLEGKLAAGDKVIVDSESAADGAARQ